jgi:hypothetical protein
VEPYVVAADVHTHPAHIGRGGWTWYTGARIDPSAIPLVDDGAVHALRVVMGEAAPEAASMAAAENTLSLGNPREP